MKILNLIFGGYNNLIYIILGKNDQNVKLTELMI